MSQGTSSPSPAGAPGLSGASGSPAFGQWGGNRVCRFESKLGSPMQGPESTVPVQLTEGVGPACGSVGKAGSRGTEHNSAGCVLGRCGWNAAGNGAFLWV